MTAVGVSGFLLFFLTPIARNIGLVDRPDHRKQHASQVPLTGGIAIVIALIFSLLVLEETSLIGGLNNYRILFLCIFIIVITGILDDHKDISARVKILVQFVVGSVLVLMGDTTIYNLGGIFFDSGNAVWLGPLAIPFSVIAIVGVINAFNMIDGHDGLACSNGIISLSAIAVLCYIRTEMSYLYFILLLILILFVFLLFNLSFIVGQARQVFMGDAGSMFLGLVIVFLLIQLSQSVLVVIKPISAPWIIGLPLLDMMSVFIIRLKNRQSPLSADRRHIHHLLLNLGFGKYPTLVLLVGLQLTFASIGVLSTIKNWSEGLLFWSMFLLLVFYILINHFILTGSRNRQ